MRAMIDGNCICIVKDDFVNLMESEAVFIEPTLNPNQKDCDTLESIVAHLNGLFAEDATEPRVAGRHGGWEKVE
jgi:hypothetical protein